MPQKSQIRWLLERFVKTAKVLINSFALLIQMLQVLESCIRKMLIRLLGGLRSPDIL